MAIPKQPFKPSNWTHKTSRSRYKVLDGKHRFEHWSRDNQVYFITARCADGFPAFDSEQAKLIFWDRFDCYTKQYEFTPWATCLVRNHYHTPGYLKYGDGLGRMMRHIHGSVAKLVNDILPSRHVPFWRGADGHDYFDGCIRDDTQCRRAYRYILIQPMRHGVCSDPRSYSHLHVPIELERGIKRALELNAFLEGVPYKRYGQQQ